MSFLQNMEKQLYVKIIFSIIWGLGIAAIFRQVCKGRDCLVIKSPNMQKYEKGVYEFDNKCYSFKSKVTTCDSKVDK